MSACLECGDAPRMDGADFCGSCWTGLLVRQVHAATELELASLRRLDRKATLAAAAALAFVVGYAVGVLGSS